jgi:hypothetical protein
VIWLTLLTKQDYNYFTQANEFVMAKVAASRKRPLPDISNVGLPLSAPEYLMQTFKYTDASIERSTQSLGRNFYAYYRRP